MRSHSANVTPGPTLSEFNKMTKQDLEGLIENYAWHIIDGLDHKSADQMLFDLLTREYEKMSWDEVTEEIVDLYDEETLIDLIPDAQ